GTLSNSHPEASEQLPTAEISHARDIPLPPEPILAPHMFDVFASNHTVSIPPCYDYAGVGQTIKNMQLTHSKATSFTNENS
ncbi:unnamed protein product, partial [Pocillopora meandrina]